MWLLLLQSYPPVLWGEAIVWVTSPVALAALFTMCAGYAASAIRISNSRRHALPAVAASIGHIGPGLAAQPAACRTPAGCMQALSAWPHVQATRHGQLCVLLEDLNQGFVDLLRLQICTRPAQIQQQLYNAASHGQQFCVHCLL